MARKSRVKNPTYPELSEYGPDDYGNYWFGPKRTLPAIFTVKGARNPSTNRKYLRWDGEPVYMILMPEEYVDFDADSKLVTYDTPQDALDEINRRLA